MFIHIILTRLTDNHEQFSNVKNSNQDGGLLKFLNSDSSKVDNLTRHR